MGQGKGHRQPVQRTIVGPGNRLIVATLLETLSSRERLGDRERVARAASPDSSAWVQADAWLGEDVMARVIGASALDEARARALGHRLVTPEALGMPLYRFGLATPEKAYRRAQSLLPRESALAQWEAGKIDGETAELVYRFPTPDSAEAAEAGEQSEGEASASAVKRPPHYWAATCAVRRGMLEAIPMLYGLLPATVEETACRARGDETCQYRVRWKRGSFRGLATGLGIGGTFGLAATASAVVLGGLAGLSIATVGLLSAAGALGIGAVGRAVDLANQLEAVAGARRGQLALFDQVDDLLAAKLDALARADAKLDADLVAPRPTQVRLEPDPEPEGLETVANEAGLLSMAEAIHSAAGDLECWFEAEAHRASKRKKKKRSRDANGLSPISDERAQLREIRDWSARIAETLAPDTPIRRTIDLERLVSRAAASVRPLLPKGARIQIDGADEPLCIEGEAVALEQVVIQLIRNAIEASESLTDKPEVWIRLAAQDGGIEVSVEDRGTGIDGTEVDEVFDPFFNDGLRGPVGGLPECLEVVEAHGGALRIEAEERAGTRISMLFPNIAPSKPERSEPPDEISPAS